MDLQTSRRALLGSLTLAPVIATAGGTSLPAVAAPPLHVEWDRAKAVMEAADAAAKRHDAQVYRPMTRLLGARPDNRFTITARNGATATYDWWPHRPDEYDNNVGLQIRDGAAGCKREWADWQDRRRTLNADPIEDEQDRLGSAFVDAAWALMLTPAPDGAALLWKLEYFWGDPTEQDGEHCASWSMRGVNALMADARRLLGREALS